MINANELRIGNYVQGPDGYVMMLTIGGADMNFIFSDRCYPIPITPEILEKCGFVTDNEMEETFAGMGIFLKLDITICRPDGAPITNDFEISGAFSTTGELKRCGYTVRDYWGSSEIRSLHQLQNLYFALTSTELEYTP